MYLSISYFVVFGEGDAGEDIDYAEVKLSEKEAKAAIGPALTAYGDYDALLERKELQKTLRKIYREIEREEALEDGCDLRMYIARVEADVEEAAAYVKQLFAKKDYGTIDEIMSGCEVKLKKSIDDIILDIAKEVGAQDYIHSRYGE